ncbi:MAG TPA: hypothetical protein VMO17_08200 [Terriglobia bacterium]|nr:hypothetical protein [Terriglobia bacterium]
MEDIRSKLYDELHDKLKAGRYEVELTLKKTFDVRAGQEQILVEILEWIMSAGQIAAYQVKKIDPADVNRPAA